MRNLAWVLSVLGAAACGEVQKLADAPPSPGDTAADASAIPDAAPCTTYTGVWQTNAITFDSQIAPTARLDFETRADGVTGVTAGTPVPRDEYLACCGVRIEYIGPAGGQVIWAGNADSGFSVRASCSIGICPSTAGIRLTFLPPVTAAGADYAGGTTATMFDAQNAVISTMAVMGSGPNFLGYQSAVRIDHADFVDGGGEDLDRLLYHRCN